MSDLIFYQRHRREKVDSARVDCATEMANLPFYVLHTLVACCLCHLVSLAAFLMLVVGFYMKVIGLVCELHQNISRKYLNKCVWFHCSLETGVACMHVLTHKY